jgi:DNA repair ATPase RecN
MIWKVYMTAIEQRLLLALEALEIQNNQQQDQLSQSARLLTSMESALASAMRQTEEVTALLNDFAQRLDAEGASLTQLKRSLAELHTRLNKLQPD